MKGKKPCILIILDGWGIGSPDNRNALFQAKTPFLDNLCKEYPHTILKCAGESVGLPCGIMGNSEVGHLNIGAGRVVPQDLLRIDTSIKDGSFFNNSILNAVIDKVKSNASALHLMGLVSDGGVHSHLNHIFALLELSKKKGLSQVYLHAILDGRDTSPTSGLTYVKHICDHMDSNHFGAISTICGRFYAMDRDNRWERVEKAFLLYTQGKGVIETDPVNAVKNAYRKNETDEFVKPIVVADKNKTPLSLINDNDGIIFFNFRSDRAKEITKAFTDPDFNGFDRTFCPKFSDFVCFTPYDKNFALPVAFPSSQMENILGEVISSHGFTQLRIAETEKYAHVTYFFNGGEEAPFSLEDRCLIPSPRDISTYDQKPEMSAYEVTRETLKRIESDAYDFIVLNFANMDMVGHTGDIPAAIKACEVIDSCVNKIVDRIKDKGGVALVTADHGNVEKMMDENGRKYTAHTLNNVPLIFVDDNRKKISLNHGSLQDIAPTILEIMKIKKPEQMTGNSLIKL